MKTVVWKLNNLKIRWKKYEDKWNTNSSQKGLKKYAFPERCLFILSKQRGEIPVQETGYIFFNWSQTTLNVKNKQTNDAKVEITTYRIQLWHFFPFPIVSQIFIKQDNSWVFSTNNINLNSNFWQLTNHVWRNSFKNIDKKMIKSVSKFFFWFWSTSSA